MDHRIHHFPLSAFLIAALISGCATVPTPLPPETFPAYPPVRFAIISDPHLYDVSLSVEGPAFERNLSGGLKLFLESGEILDEGIRGVKEAAPRFVIVPGDLTKDGERASHLLMASRLHELLAEGIPVYVVPGNHDVRNPSARRYVGDRVEKVENVSPKEFTEIYRDFGYGQALLRDPSSLSYVVEPVPGLWLVGLDSCRYGERNDRPVTAGRLTPETLAWLKDALRAAARTGKAVCVFMHHGAMDHFKGQDFFLGEYVLENHEELARILAEYGARMVFTGHGHTQDITVERFRNGRGDRFLFDVETGSLSSLPNPYRIVEIGMDGRMGIESRFITATKSHPDDFPGHAESRLRGELTETAVSILKGALVGGQSARVIAEWGVDAGVVFYRGDEPGAAPMIDATRLDWWGGVVAGFLRGPLTDMDTDLIPGDNTITIDLEDGSWE
jgi:3',5'-cyclic AMP phosphodiesterase CpdA